MTPMERALEAEVIKQVSELSDLVAERNTYLRLLEDIRIALLLPSESGDDWQYSREALSAEIWRILTPARERNNHALEAKP